MTNYLYNILLINASTDQLVPCLSGLRRLTITILMRCRFPGVGSNPRNGLYVLIIFSPLFLSICCPPVFCFKFCMSIFIYVVTSSFMTRISGIIRLRKPKLFSFFFFFCFFFLSTICFLQIHVRLVSVESI